jgi:hypothetical protein
LQDKLEAANLMSPENVSVPSQARGDPSTHSAVASVHSVSSRHCMQVASAKNTSMLNFLIRFVDSDGKLDEMTQLLTSLKLLKHSVVGTADFKEALAGIGFQISDREAEVLLRCVLPCSLFFSHQLPSRLLFVPRVYPCQQFACSCLARRIERMSCLPALPRRRVQAHYVPVPDRLINKYHCPVLKHSIDVHAHLRCLNGVLTRPRCTVCRYISQYEEVSRSAFVASQLDWGKLQENHTSMWLECARETFKTLEPNDEGVVAVDNLMRKLKKMLGDDDVDLAVEEEMINSCADSCGVTFEQFVALLQEGQSTAPSPLMYDSRYVGTPPETTLTMPSKPPPL